MQIKIDITTKQKQALQLLMDNDSKVTEVLYGGGARGGKTWLGCLWQITRRLQYAGSASLICRQKYVDLKDTTLTTFRKVVKAMRVEHLLTLKEGQGGCTAYFANGSIIYFRYCIFQPLDPEFDRFGSYDLTDIFIDEAQQVAEKFISVIRGRFSLLSGINPDGTTWKCKPKMLMVCNPSKGWIYRLFWKPYREGNLPPYRVFIRALVRDNPYVDEAYIENLLRSDRVTIERLFYGNFDYDDDPNALFDTEALNDMFTNEVSAEGLAAGGADIALKGRDKYASCVARGRVYTFDRVKGYSPADVVLEDAQQTIKAHAIPRSRFVADSDGVGGFLADFVKGIKEFHGGAVADDAATYRNLKSEYYYKLAGAVNRREIRVQGLNAEQVEELKEELSVIRVADIDRDDKKKAINSKDEQKKLLGRSPDLADTLMMAFYANSRPSGRMVASVGRIR